MKWNETGDAFIILNTHEFLKILPGYFKTKNFASFVRQLNMYSFYKVKSKRNLQEFRHPFFRKDQANDLKYIKRKNVNKKLKLVNNCWSKGDQIDVSKNQVKEQIDKLQSVLEFISEQNKTLAMTNRSIISQLHNSRGFCEEQIRELTAMMFVTISVNNRRLKDELRDFISSLNINLSMVPSSVFGERNLINVDSVIQSSSESNFNLYAVVDKFLDIYRAHQVCEIDIQTFSSKEIPNHGADSLYFPGTNDDRADTSFILQSMNNSDKNAVFTAHTFNSETEVFRINNSLTTEVNIRPFCTTKNELIIEDICYNDDFFTILYNDKENDLVSPSEFIHTPITPLFQEEF